MVLVVELLTLSQKELVVLSDTSSQVVVLLRLKHGV